MPTRWFLLLPVFVAACNSPAKPVVNPFTAVLTKDGNYWIYHPDARKDSGIVYSWCTRYSSKGTYTTYYFDKRGLRDALPPVEGDNPYKGAWWFRESDQTFGLGDGERDEGSKRFHVLHYNADTVALRGSEGNQVFLVRRQQ